MELEANQLVVWRFLDLRGAVWPKINENVVLCYGVCVCVLGLLEPNCA